MFNSNRIHFSTFFNEKQLKISSVSLKKRINTQVKEGLGSVAECRHFTLKCQSSVIRHSFDKTRSRHLDVDVAECRCQPDIEISMSNSFNKTQKCRD